VGNLKVDLSPLGTGVSTKADASGLFCPSQATAGCFGQATCRSLTENGSPAGPLSIGTPKAVTLASTFCVPKTNNILIDLVANLPGPGATALPGQYLIQ
jgi:hypothetical protein